MKDRTNRLCPCGEVVHAKDVCQKHYLAQWKQTPRGKVMISMSRVRHATEVNAARRAYRAARPGEHSKRVKEYHRRLRAQIIAGLGSVCACCDEREPIFLQLDHIHGGGARHYRMKGQWAAVYRDVIALGFPRDQFRLLCSNCNSAIGRYGTCPHETIRVVEALLTA